MFMAPRKPKPGRDLATLGPDLAKQAYGWDPATVTFCSGMELDWKCPLGHVWNARVSSRKNGSGCSVCSGHKVLVGFNDLATLRPDLAAQAYGWDPTTVTHGSKKKFDWSCEKGHMWRATVEKRSIGRGCHFCSGYRVLAGFNDLGTTNPDLAAQAYGWDPSTISAGSDNELEWQCRLGHVWSSTASNRVAGNGCGVCVVRASRNILVGFNDLGTTNPDLAAQAYGWDPTAVSAGSDGKRKWQCPVGHVWMVSASSRSGGRGCPICSSRQVLAGYNDLATTNSKLAAQANSWDTKTVTAGSHKKLSWRCELGHVWSATVCSRSVGQGCPTCAPIGFDPNAPGWLYFIEHLGSDLLQIGISNKPEQRLKSHARRGWAPIDVQGPWGIGEVAHQWEQSILRYLRSRGAVFASDAGIERFDGYTEAWLRTSFPVTSLKQLRALVDDDETA